MDPVLHSAEWCKQSSSSSTNHSHFGLQVINGTYWPPHPDPTYWREVDYVVVLKLIAYAVIFVGGLLGNVSVILAVCLNRSMRNTTNYYVANLAVADAMICLFCMTFHAFSVVTKDRYFVLGAFMCKFSPMTQVTCLTSSALTLSAISCDRVMAILFPLRARVTKQRTSVVMAIIWTLSAAVSVPFYFTREQIEFRFVNFVITRCVENWTESHYYDAAQMKCYTRQPLRIAYHVVITVFLFFLPLFIMVTAYSLILWRLWRTEVPGEQCASNVDAHTRAKRKIITVIWFNHSVKVNKMVFIVLVALFVCGTPLQFILLYDSIRIPDLAGPLPDWFFWVNWCAYFLTFSNSFLNPFIYGGFNKDYLKGFCNIFRCGQKGGTYSSGSARSRLTFTTGLSSRNASKSLNRISQKSTMEMKLLQRLADGKNSPNALNS